MSALLPCPFCGEGADLMELFEGFCGECGNCETTGPAAGTEAAAIAAWNQRATPAEVAGLRAERDKYQRRSEVAERAFWRLVHNHTTLRAEVERLRGAVRSIANQKLQTEMQEDEYPIADFHGAYGAIVEVARAALTPKEPGNEG